MEGPSDQGPVALAGRHCRLGMNDDYCQAIIVKLLSTHRSEKRYLNAVHLPFNMLIISATATLGKCPASCITYSWFVIASKKELQVAGSLP